MEWGEEWWVGPACERRLRREVRPHRAIFSWKKPEAEISIDVIYCIRGWWTLSVGRRGSRGRYQLDGVVLNLKHRQIPFFLKKKIINAVGLKLLCTTKSLLCLIYL
jgi:hypothetical protein